jgi:hypothetical protein
MIKILLLVISVASIVGCSSSDDTTPAGFILGYSQDPFTSTENQRAFEVFPLKVVNNGTAVKGATVHYTAYQTHSIVTDTLPAHSDVNGEFLINGKRFALALDSLTGVTFYASKDSLKSNTLTWHR